MVSHHRDTLQEGNMPKVTANICKNRHGMFYFRLIIPSRLRIHFPRNKREIRRSLKTDSQSLAIKRARQMRVRYDMLFEEIETMSKYNKHYYTTSINAFGEKVEADYDDPDKEKEVIKDLIEHSFEMKEKYGTTQPNLKKSSTTPTISELAKTYLHVKAQRSKLTDKTLKEYQTAYDTLIFILGDIEVGELTPENMNQFYDELRKLPSNRNSSSLFKGRMFSELKHITIPEDKIISVSTSTKIMNRVSGLLGHAVKQQIIQINPANSVTLEKDQIHSRNKREHFTDDELIKIFESPHFTKGEWWKGRGRMEPYRFWLPLIALFTGARLAEICQLHKADIYDDNGIWVFNIKEDHDEFGRKIKSIKNQNSIRKIPISQKLIDIGILDYASKINNKELFPELNSKSNGVDAAQKWVNNFLKKCGVHTKHTKTFHSLRHSFVNHLANSGAEPKYIGAVTGHLNKSDFGDVAELANTYFKGFSANILKENVIDHINYNLNFDDINWN